MKTYVGTLKAMASNYGEGHRWDYLDKMACEGAAEEIERLKARVASLEAAIWDFKPSAQVAFLWQVNGAREGEVERYKDRYQALLTVLDEGLLTPAPNAPMLPTKEHIPL